jgi:hypothetical protein
VLGLVGVVEAGNAAVLLRLQAPRIGNLDKKSCFVFGSRLGLKTRRQVATLQGTSLADRRQSVGSHPPKRSEGLSFLAASESRKDVKSIISNRTLSFVGFGIFSPPFGVCCVPASFISFKPRLPREERFVPKWHGALHRLSREALDLLRSESLHQGHHNSRKARQL